MERDMDRPAAHDLLLLTFFKGGRSIILCLDNKPVVDMFSPILLNRERKITLFKFSKIQRGNLSPLLQEFFLTRQLVQSQGGLNIRHLGVETHSEIIFIVVLPEVFDLGHQFF